MKIKVNERGTQGYLNRLKRNRLIFTAALLIAALTMFFAALAILETKANIFSIMAVLTMLPAAKGMVAVIVTFPHHSVPAADVELAKQTAPADCNVMTDMLISSPDRLMFAEFVAIGGKDILCLATGAKNVDRKLQEYLTECIKAQKFDYRVRVTNTKEHFLRELKVIDTTVCNDQQEEEAVTEFILSLVYR